nr:hypothetical protein [Hoeflea ulvae]
MPHQTGLDPAAARGGFLGETGELHLACAPFLRREKTPQGYLVQAPILQETVALDAEDWAFLDHFRGLETAGDVAALLLSEAQSAGKYQSQMEIYLGVERFRAMGLLVETRLMPVAELATLLRPDPGMQPAYGTPEDPVAITRRMDGRWILVQGDSAVRAALRRQVPLRASILSHPAALARLASLPDEFFGTARGGIPYQSIFHEDVEIVRGRRPDLHERFAKIDPADLVGKRDPRSRMQHRHEQFPGGASWCPRRPGAGPRRLCGGGTAAQSVFRCALPLRGAGSQPCPGIRRAL